MIYIISVIIYPKQPISYLKKKLNLNTNHNPIEESTSFEIFTYKDMSHYVYYLDRGNINMDTVILDLPGGAFISSSNTLIPYHHINQPYNIFSIEYPVLPDGNYTNTFSYLVAVIDYLINKYGIQKIILAATSAGCYYAVKLINSEHFLKQIIKFIGVSGYYGYNTLPNIGTYITEKLYLHSNTDDESITQCVSIPTHIQTFYAVGEDDPLKISTYEFLKLNSATDEIIEYSKGKHCFYLRFNDPITKEYYEQVGFFISMT